MQRSLRPIAWLAVFLAAVAAKGASEPTDAPNTLQANLVLAPLAIRARITDARPYGTPRDGVDQFRIEANVEETFHGDAPPRIIFAAYLITEDAPIRQRDIGREMLLFLRPAQLGEQERRDCGGCGWELDNEAGIVPFIHLSQPVPERVVGQELEVLSDPASILAAVRSVSQLNLKDHSIVQVRLTSGKVIGLLDDGKLPERGTRWAVSRNPDLRSASVDLLEPLNDPDSEARLIRLLDDPYVNPPVECCQNFDPWFDTEYYIRERAWVALQARNVAASKGLLPPKFTVDPGLYHSFSRAGVIGSVSALLMAVIGCFVGFAWVGGIRKWWVASAILTLLVIGSACLLKNRLIDLTHGAGKDLQSLTLARGELIYRHYPSLILSLPSKTAWGVFRIGGDPLNWHDPTAQLSQMGVTHAVPLWPLTLVPLLPACAGFFAWKRRRTRLQAGCCTACGYDLRASTGCCTECGKPIESIRSGHVIAK